MKVEFEKLSQQTLELKKQAEGKDDVPVKSAKTSSMF